MASPRFCSLNRMDVMDLINFKFREKLGEVVGYRYLNYTHPRVDTPIVFRSTANPVLSSLYSSEPLSSISYARQCVPSLLSRQDRRLNSVKTAENLQSEG